MPTVSPRGIETIAVGSAFLFIATLVIGLRIWARNIKGRRLGLSDWLAIVSLLMMYLLSAIIFAGIAIGGGGYHQTQVTSSTDSGYTGLDQAAKIVFIAELFWLTANTLTKLSTLTFYLDIFNVGRFRYAIYFVMLTVVVSLFAFLAKEFLDCLPLSRNWTFEDHNFCGISPTQTLATGIAVTIMDVMVVVLPIPILLKLQMPLFKKVMICGIFSLGLTVCIISGLRLHSATTLDLEDLTYSIIPLAMFTLIEPLLGIIVACLPTLHPVLIRCFRIDIFRWNWRRSSRRSTTLEAGGKRSANTPTATGNTDGTSRTVSSNRKSFKKLYDHLYPVTLMTNIGKTAPGADEEEQEAKVHFRELITLDAKGSNSSRNTVHITVEQSRGGSNHGSTTPSMAQSGGINVTTEFSVNSVRIAGHDDRYGSSDDPDLEMSVEELGDELRQNDRPRQDVEKGLHNTSDSSFR